MLEERFRNELNRKPTDENDPFQANDGLSKPLKDSAKDTDRSKKQAEVAPLSLKRNASNLSAKLKDLDMKNEGDEDKKSELSRKGSHRTNISRRYQEPDDEDDEEEKESQRSSSRVSYSRLSQTYSQKKVESMTNKRNTHDIKSLERLCQPTSTKSIKARDTSNDL